MTTEDPGEIDVWTERFQAIHKAWEMFIREGVLSPHFIKSFSKDLRNVALQVNPGLDTGKLSDKQSTMTFALSNLRALFGDS